MTNQRRPIEAYLEDEPTRTERTPAQGTVSGAVPATHREGAEDDMSQGADEEVPTLYERLQRSGALGEVMQAAAREDADIEMLDEDARPTLPRAPRTVSEVVAKPATADEEIFEVEDSGSIDITGDFFAVPGEEEPATASPARDASASADPTVPVIVEVSERAPRQSLTSQSANLSRERPGVSRGFIVALVLLFGAVAGGVGTLLLSRLDTTSESREPTPRERTAPPVVTPMPEPVVSKIPEAPVEAAPEEPANSDSAPTADSDADREAAEARRARRSARDRRAAAAAAAEPPAPSADEAARTPSREAVIAVMQALTPELERCAGDTHGLARLTMTVSGRGRVMHVLVGGDYDGTPQGSCIAKAARSAQFPSFEQASMKLTYPARL